VTPSVYLIIAGALLGPIEARLFDDYAVYVQCAEEKSGGKGMYVTQQVHAACRAMADLTKRIENSAETCERAMKEIGAVRGQFISIANSLGQYSAPRFSPWGNANAWAIGHERVLCIPAPSGLRK